ncbi:MAG: YkgJ family cysteine cluster protein [bacterium]
MPDSKLMKARELARIACAECEGCGECCRGMGDSILLDPWDVFHLTKELGKSFEELLEKEIDLAVAKGAILPHLSMKGESCPFLGEDGRCKIHAFRPGLCRLYPLGRQYHDGEFSYFILPASCLGKKRNKVRISAYLEVPDLRQYEDFLLSWHGFLESLREKMVKAEAAAFKEICMAVLRLFYFLPYESGRDFYLQYRRRLKKAERNLLL